MQKEIIIKIILVVLFAFILRVLFLDSSSFGVYVDEAAIGYNAFSLVHTGRDEYSQIFPIFLRSYGALTSALVLWFEGVPIFFFGLNVFTLRITPVILGTVSVLLMIILASKWFKSIKDGIRAGILLAVAPSHVLWSRSFYESVLGLTLFLIALCKKGLTRMLFLSLAAYSYQSLRLTVYVYILFYLLKKKVQIKELLFFVLTQVPLLYLSTFPGVNNRALQLSWLNLTPHNFTSILKEFLSQYLSYLSPTNLFWYPDPDLQRSLPMISIFYSWQIFPYLIGLWMLRKPISKRLDLLVLYLIFPLSASLTRDPFSTLRAILVYVPVTMIIVLGMKRINGKIFSLLMFVSIFWLLRSLFILLPNERSVVWNLGYKELFSYLNAQNNLSVVDVDKPVYILDLFYNKIDPSLVQSKAPHFKGLDYYKDANWTNYWQTGKVQYRPLIWKNDVCTDQFIVGNDLLISKEQSKEHYLDLVIKIDPNLVIYKTNPSQKCPLNKLQQF